MFKAFEGANGWYVAWEDEDGYQRQFSGGKLTRQEAERRAAERNAEEKEDERVSWEWDDL